MAVHEAGHYRGLAEVLNFRLRVLSGYLIPRTQGQYPAAVDSDGSSGDRFGSDRQNVIGCDDLHEIT
jgi:hypothetical protein